MVVIEKSKEQKISDLVLYILMGLGALVLVIFLSWGYDTPYEENPDFNAPLFSDGLIIIQMAYIVICAIAMVAGAVHSLTLGGKKSDAEEREEVAAKVSNPIAWGLCVVSLVAGVAYGFMNQNEEMIINNQAWSDPTLSIISDTCCVSIGILAIGTVVSAIYSMVSRK